MPTVNNLSERGRQLCLVFSLLLLTLVAACAPHRQSGGLDRGFAVDAYTVDNGSGAAVTVVDTRRRALNRQTGERDGPWESVTNVLPGPSNGAVAIQAIAGVVAAGVNATGAVLAARELSCRDGRCGSGSGTAVYVEAGAYSEANATGTGSATVRNGH